MTKTKQDINIGHVPPKQALDRIGLTVIAAQLFFLIVLLLFLLDNGFKIQIDLSVNWI